MPSFHSERQHSAPALPTRSYDPANTRDRLSVRTNAQRHIPNVRTQLVPNVNHMMTIDCPELLVTEMMKAFA